MEIIISEQISDTAFREDDAGVNIKNGLWIDSADGSARSNGAIPFGAYRLSEHPMTTNSGSRKEFNWKFESSIGITNVVR